MADAICLVCGEMYNPALGHVCPGAPSSPETVAPPPAGPMCELCGKPGTPVSTVDGGTKILCDACQGSHRCSQCGQVAMELKSEGFGYELVQPDGTIRSEHQTIKGVCDECLAAWKRKYNQ